MTLNIEDLCDDLLSSIETDNNLRQIEPFERRVGRYIFIDGRRYIDFSSNDYLLLSTNAELIRRLKIRYNDNKYFTVMGSGGSRLLGGAYSIFEELEEEAASFINKEAALVFGSGYLANLGVISALGKVKGSCIIMDKLCHASIIDGAILSGIRFMRFQHNDVNHLESLLKKASLRFRHLIVTIESIYSMDGDIAPIRDIVSLKERYGFTLVIDEAHAIGAIGDKGGGVLSSMPEIIKKGADVVIGTFGKALGGYGAFCATSKKLKDFFINFARSFIFSTALPIPVLMWNIEAIKVAQSMNSERARLNGNILFFKRIIEKFAFFTPSSSHIMPIVLKDNDKTLFFQNILRQYGIYVRAIRPPTVPKGSARLRFSLNCGHSIEDFNVLETAFLKGGIF